MAREVRKQEGKLGAQEIEVGEARFAAGDQVITRVNDRSRGHLQPRALADRRGRRRAAPRRPRRHRPGEASRGRRRVPGPDQPALRGPGARARLRGDDLLGAGQRRSTAPSSWPIPRWTSRSSTSPPRAAARRPTSTRPRRSRPTARRSRRASPYLREGIPHIAEAAERDRAQLAAHDVAQLEALPTAELIERRDEPPAAGAPGADERGASATEPAEADRAGSASSSPASTPSASGPKSCRASCAAPSLSGSTAPRRAANERSPSWRPSFARCRRSSTGPPRAGGRRAGPRRTPTSGGPRRPPRPSDLHHQGAGGEAARSARSRERGIAAWRRSRATASSTGSRTRTGPSGESARERSSSEPPCGASTRPSGCSGWGSTHPESAILGGGWGSGGSPFLRRSSWRRPVA